MNFIAMYKSQQARTKIFEYDGMSPRLQKNGLNTSFKPSFDIFLCTEHD